MNNKKILIISSLSMLSVIVLIIAIILFSINNREKTITDNMDQIKSNYANLSLSLIDNAEIITNLSDKLSEFKQETYQEEHGGFVEILRKYDKNIQYIDNLIKDLEKRCEYTYEDVAVSILCQGYDAVYEETINTYITNINKYNDKLTKYNETAEVIYKTHKPIYEKYIDYDKDGKYEEK